MLGVRLLMSLVGFVYRAWQFDSTTFSGWHQMLGRHVEVGFKLGGACNARCGTTAKFGGLHAGPGTEIGIKNISSSVASVSSWVGLIMPGVRLQLNSVGLACRTWRCEVGIKFGWLVYAVGSVSNIGPAC